MYIFQCFSLNLSYPLLSLMCASSFLSLFAIKCSIRIHRVSQVALVVKNPPSNAGKRCRVDPWIGKIPWRKQWQPTQVFLPGKSPWTEEPGKLQYIGLQKIRQGWASEHTTHIRSHKKSLVKLNTSASYHLSPLAETLSGLLLVILFFFLFTNLMGT